MTYSHYLSALELIDKRVCLSVNVSVQEHTSIRNQHIQLHQIFYAACGWLGPRSISGRGAIIYVFPGLYMTSYFLIVGPMAQATQI